MTTQYVVKYTYYRYNSGDGDNSNVFTSKSFDNYKDAIDFANEIKKAEGGGSPWTWDFYDRFCNGDTGYIVEFHGLFVRVICESKVELP